ncbi:MAG: phosphoribosylamine--glycine ligase [Actinobacteria bacterium]|nr:phosphoribosylamine--glycine ligase [Actinomycetota bacterium]
MKVMVIGGGGREHALGWKLSMSNTVNDLLFVPGNGGMEELGECIKADILNLDSVADIAVQRGVDLTIVGPEEPLVKGIVDHFNEKGLKIFGPTGRAAQVEGSKHFAKSILERHGIPTGEARLFGSFDEASAYAKSLTPPIVVKADGLAAGKGVIIAESIDEAVSALSDCLVDKVFGESGDQVLIEEYLEGPEVSILTLSDGKGTSHMVASQDHKKAYDGDTGPNTGGMGAYSPVPLLDKQTESYIHRNVMDATIAGMSEDGIPYKGVLYGGLILTSDGPKVLEYNVRFGDPETQAVLPRLKSDLIPGIVATMDGTMSDTSMQWLDNYCVCVVIASGGYPGKYNKGIPITGLKAAASDSNVEVFHAGTKNEDGKIVTAGGRVLNVVARGSSFEEARGLAYQSIRMIDFENMQYRTDIGHRAM